MNTKISIILPAYNVGDYLKRSMKSILSQTLESYEVIVVNDGSTDNTLELFHQLNLDKRFSIYTKKNEGSGLARNYGLNIAKGEYIYFMDPDDEIEPDLLESNVRVLEKTKSDFSIFGYRTMDSTRKVSGVFAPDVYLEIQDKYQFRKELINLAQQTSIYAVWNKVYRKEFIEKNKAKFTNLPIGQDAEFNWNLYSYTNSIVQLPEIYYTYFINRPGSARTSYNSQKFKSEKKIATKMINTVKKWEKFDKYKEFIYEYTINSIVREIKNIRKQDFFSYESLKNDVFTQKVKTIKLSEIKGSKMRMKLMYIKIFL
ncbi:Hyaluronan synthase [Aerococcus viridans]|nr:Hyaluronan synthase [Aerococcus viridans]